MWLKRLYVAMAIAFLATTAVQSVAVWQFQPRVYDLVIRTPARTAYWRATAQHVVVGECRTAEVTARDRAPCVWRLGSVELCSNPWSGSFEQDYTDFAYDEAMVSHRSGNFGYLHGENFWWAPSRRDVLMPSSAALAIGLTPIGTVAVYRLLGRRARRRRARGQCVACGYDLRATPGRCPECGAEPPAGARAVPSMT